MVCVFFTCFSCYCYQEYTNTFRILQRWKNTWKIQVQSDRADPEAQFCSHILKVMLRPYNPKGKKGGGRWDLMSCYLGNWVKDYGRMREHLFLAFGWKAEAVSVARFCNARSHLSHVWKNIRVAQTKQENYIKTLSSVYKHFSSF